MEKINARTLKAAIRANVAKEARIVTDEESSYVGIGTEFDVDIKRSIIAAENLPAETVTQIP